jgi:hypothetical protein
MLLPLRVDNTYRGHKLGLVLFGLFIFLKVIMSLRSITNGVSIAIGDGIPLDTFPPPAAQAYVSLFALFGLSQFMLCLLSILALARYRALVPLMFALYLMEFLGRRLILQFMPVERTETPVPTIINLVLLAVMLVGLALSLWSQRPPLVGTVTRD